MCSQLPISNGPNVLTAGKDQHWRPLLHCHLSWFNRKLIQYYGDLEWARRSTDFQFFGGSQTDIVIGSSMSLSVHSFNQKFKR